MADDSGQSFVSWTSRRTHRIDVRWSKVARKPAQSGFEANRPRQTARSAVRGQFFDSRMRVTPCALPARTEERQADILKRSVWRTKHAAPTRRGRPCRLVGAAGVFGKKRPSY